MNSYYPPFNAQGGAFAPALPIANAEDAGRAQVPFDGRPYGFIDPAGDKIYAKRFDSSTGCTRFEVYVKTEPAPPPRYATIEDLERLKAELMRGAEANV